MLNKNPNARQFEEDQRELQKEHPEASIMPSPQKRVPGQPLPPGQQPPPAHMQPPRQAKTILYSDKSETSVEDLMDDTPSNYNI